MAIKFVKDLDTGLILGQFVGEGKETSNPKGRQEERKVLYYYHQNGTVGHILTERGKVIGGFRRHRYFK